MNKSILMYGRDRELLRTRTWVLETRGYHVVTASHLSDIPRIRDTEAFNLLILCHSVMESECEFVRIVAVSRWPSIVSLVLHAGSSGCSDLSDTIFNVGDGPARLLLTVQAQVDHL